MEVEAATTRIYENKENPNVNISPKTFVEFKENMKVLFGFNSSKTLAKLSFIKPTDGNVSFASIDEDNLKLNTMPIEFPLKEIPLKNICGIEFFDSMATIITNNCIVIIDTTTGNVRLHIRQPQFSLLDRIRYFFTPPKA